jgi:transcriptional regulator with XRE-family HTH domain
MLPSTPSPEAGKRLRAERLRVRLSTREVAHLSQKIARRRGNAEYSISHAWLTDVENGKFMPGIFRLHSLSLIYGKRFDEMVAFFDINVRDIGKEQLPLGLPRTHLIGPTLEETRQTILAPLELRAQIQLEKTNLVGEKCLSDYCSRWIGGTRCTATLDLKTTQCTRFFVLDHS